MAWETRGAGQKRYFYESVRVDGRSQKIYFGSGDRAREMAQKNAEARAARAARLDADTAAAAALMAEWKSQEELADKVDDQIDLLMQSVLLAAGCHNHHGQWRRKRHGRQTPNQPG